MSTVIVTLDGADITSMVLFESAHFESQVNGVAGEARFRVRDLTGTYSINLGSEVTLSVDGSVVWRGFLMQWTRVYVFPALNVTEFGVSRFFDATCADINVLFTKRFIYNQSTPTNILAPLLAEHTADTTALTELFADWIDLTGDGIDTTSLVENVGDTTWTQEGRAWSGSDSWGQAVSSIANMPAAIYYIDPDKNFVYTDVDTPNAPFGLSDQPNGSTTKGYSSMDILKDGTGLANDVFAWGAGYGSNQPVFVRNQDATSQSEHGVWQSATTVFGVFKQATIERIAESIIDGSPQSKRGAKDDRLSVTCVTYESGLRVAEKVDFTSNVFGFNDVIPIRKMAIDFESPEKPKYSLTLSHEIDTPFSFFDPFMFDFRFPPFGGIVPPGFVIPGPIACSPSVCGITDSFNRTVGSGWGQSDYGTNWVTSQLFTGASVDVDGSRAVIHLVNTIPADVRARMDLNYASPTATDNILLSGVQMTYVPGTLNSSGMQYRILPDFFSSYSITFFYGLVSGVPTQDWRTTDASPGTQSLGTLGVDGLQPVNIRMQASTAVWRFKVWNVPDPEPTSWSFESTHPLSIYAGGAFRIQADSLSIGTTTIYIDYLDIEGSNRCTGVQYDNFQRTVSPDSWGVATPGGFTWNNLGPGTATRAVFDDWYGNILQNDPGVVPNQHGNVYTYDDTSTAIWGGDFNMLAVFRINEFPNPSFSGSLATWGVGLSETSPYDGSFDQAIFITKRDAGHSGNDTLTLSLVGGSTTIDLGFTLTDWYNDDQGVYWLRWVKAGSSHKVTFWPNGTTEPSPDIATTDSIITPLVFTIFQQQPFTRVFSGGDLSNLDTSWISIDFDYSGRPCYPGGPDSTQLPPANAWACESIIASGSPYFPLSRSFILNSPQVWVSGILQSQASYIQDATAGTIVLDFTPDPGSAVRICYWSLP